jgi:hypothetical protein
MSSLQRAQPRFMGLSVAAVALRQTLKKFVPCEGQTIRLLTLEPVPDPRRMEPDREPDPSREINQSKILPGNHWLPKKNQLKKHCDGPTYQAQAEHWEPRL